ncbi:MAG TPA: hypothetical protein ENK18_11140 [Deltaproteobacteria bacterium]|nr:hypothetical protein [Deltaproteobacteria bacterium]
MSYVVGEILLPIVLLSQLAALIGWMSRGYVERWHRGPRDPAALLRQRLQEQIVLAARLQEDLERARSQLRERAVPAVEVSDDALPETLARKQRMLEDLEGALASSRQAVEVRSEQLERARAQLQALERALASSQGRVRQLEDRIRPLPTRPPADEMSLAEARAYVEALAVRAAGPGGAHDDLRQLRGIGPKLGDALRELGFTRFEQLARLPDDDLEVVAKALQLSVRRMEQDGWLLQARELSETQDGGP